MNIKHTGIGLAFVVMLTLSSCIGIDAEVRIGEEGSVEMSLLYEISIAMEQIGKLGANERYLPLPVGQNDMSLAIARTGGELLSWSREDGPDRFVINTRIRFPTIPAFVAFMDPSGQAVSFTEDSTNRRLSIQLTGGRVPADPELTRFLQTAFSDYTTAINFILPQSPATASNLIVEGSQASFSMSSSELYTSPAPVILVLEW